MSEQAWNDAFVRCFGVQLFGGEIDIDEHGEPIVGDTMLMLFNADHQNAIDFHLPPTERGLPWNCSSTPSATTTPTRRGPSRERSN